MGGGVEFQRIRKIVLTSSLKYRKGREFDFSYIFLFLWEKEEGVFGLDLFWWVLKKLTLSE